MTVPKIIQWAMLVGVLATNVYRAKTQSLTIDEAFSYKDYVMAPYEEARKHLDPNNHVLNTLLEKQTVSWFGSSELSIRTPSLLGGAMYMVSALLLVGIMVGETWAAVALFAAMILNPIVLDYMSAARGYSLGLGFEFLGVLLMAREMRSPGSKTRGALMCVAIGVAFGLSAASNLTFLIPNAVLAAGFFLLPLLFGRKQDPEQTGLQAGLLVVAAGITLTEMPFDVFQGVGPASFYLGEATIAKSAYVLFQRSFACPMVMGGRLLPPVLALLTIAAVLAGIAMAVRKRDEMQALFPLGLLGSIAILVGLHLVIGIPYPYERTGIYLLPLMTLSIGCAVASKGLVGKAALVFVALVVIQYGLEWKTAWYEEWRFDSGTKRVFAELEKIHDQSPRALRLGVSWQYEASGSYYRQRFGMNWLAPLNRDNARTESFDYYYVAPQDDSLLTEKKLKVIYRDAMSDGVLAAP